VPEYRIAASERAAGLDAEAEEPYREGVKAKEHDDAYTLSTVFFASVSLRLEWWPLRLAVFGLGTLMPAVGLVRVVSQPIA
jgi:hypothetical protein